MIRRTQADPEVRLQGTHTGVGPALRKARLLRGLSLREASRDTRIRPELLEALEKERFEALIGEVYVRGALRSYSSYLGLNPDKVVEVYARARRQASPPRPAPPPAPDAIGRAIAAKRRRDDHRLVLLVAAAALTIASALGVLSASRSAPPPADLTPSPVPLRTGERGISVVVAAHREVEVTVTVDGAAPETFTLRAEEERSFEADRSLTLALADGAAASVSVNGVDRGRPGEPGRPWQETFSYGQGGAPAGG